MLFAPRAATKPMTELLRRIGLSLEAGIDIRKVLANESARTTGPMRSRVLDMSDAVSRGSPLAEAMARTGEYFPQLVRELVNIGEQTGHLPEVLRQLVVHYEQQQALRRSFTSTIAWPMIQLGMSLAVIGFLIWFSGVIRGMTGNPTDLLGLGLTGNFGLIIYVVFLQFSAASMRLIARFWPASSGPRRSSGSSSGCRSSAALSARSPSPDLPGLCNSRWRRQWM